MKVLVIAQLLLAASGGDGLTMHFERSLGRHIQRVTVTAQGHLLRIDDPDAMFSPVYLFDAQAHVATMLVPDRKVYFRRTQADHERLLAERQAILAKQAADREAEEAKLPPRIRAQLAAHRPPPPALEIHSMHQKRKVGGLSCELYDREEPGTQSQVCVAIWIDAKLTPDDLRILAEQAQLLSDGAHVAPENAMSEASLYPGVPVQTIMLGVDGEVLKTFTLAGITRGPVAPAIFAVPEGYRLVTRMPPP